MSETAEAVPAATSATPVPQGVVPQHLLLVLPSTGEFDSRSYRIATAMMTRGHKVTMLARWKAGLAEREQHPAGYEIIRVHASTADGIPFKPLIHLAGKSVRGVNRLLGRNRAKPASSSSSSAASASTSTSASTSASTSSLSAQATAPSAPSASAKPGPQRRASWPRRTWNSTVRKFAMPLTIRSHTRNARALAPRADLAHGMAYMGIPIALDQGRRQHIPVIYDARDIYLEARTLAKSRGITRYLAARSELGWAKRATRVITVNDAYANVMAERLRVERPLVVMNCSYRSTPAEPRERRFHEKFGLDPARKIVLYHGGLFPERGVEELLEAMPAIPGATLVLMGYGVLEPEFRQRASQPDLADRVCMMGAVDPSELVAWVACADVVAMPIQASTLNHRLTTPNKLFEAMAAGVPSVVSDLEGMAAIVRETGCGLLVDPTDVLAIGNAIREVISLPDEEWQAWRQRCLAAAHETYNWEVQVSKLIDLYSASTGRTW